MRTKLVYSAPVGVFDSLEEPVTNLEILAALAGMSCPEGSVLEYLDDDIPNRTEFRGGYPRLVLEGKNLRVQIEIDSPRKLKPSELAALRDDLGGQVSDGIGEGAFDFIADSTSLAVLTFPDLGRGKSTLKQTSGDAWQPGKRSAENAANSKRCRAAATLQKAAERAKEKAAAKKKGAKPNPKKLFRLISGGNRKSVAAEVEKLGGDLSFIKSGSFPYDNFDSAPVLRVLLDAGLNPNQFDRDGHSLLWLAAGNADCTALMLDRGAEVDFRDDGVETALMRAAWLNIAGSVRVLLAYGANPHLKTTHNTTALDEAKNGVWGPSRAVIPLLTKAMKKK